MRQGMSPGDACAAAVERIMLYYGTAFHLGLVCMDTSGNVGASGQGWTWNYAVASDATGGVASNVYVAPLPPLPAGATRRSIEEARFKGRRVE